MDQNNNDAMLLEQIQKGDHQAFTILLKRHWQRFYRQAYVMTYNTQLAEDIIQAAFLKLWESPFKFDTNKNIKFTTWFHKVIVNLVIDANKKHKELIDNDLITNHIDEHNQDMQHDLDFKKQLSTLPTNQRAALNLCYFDGLSHQEAAMVLNMSVKALESLLFRAKASLKKLERES